MKRNQEREFTAGLTRRLAKRLPEIVITILLVFTGFSLWLETQNAVFAAEFVNRILFDRTHSLETIPLTYKLSFTIPALILVLLFTEDIIKVSVFGNPDGNPVPGE